ncbi:phospholipid-transporting ATPase ABCA3 [Drosophila eugracilis]|uniref:phospholipid-transporting ATPase ABCA3 n=1 Tax=Drosophila eugracilis TaxID=29029 RepID=UPI001BD986A7|nr:phospholipid-transporting ATPase ABCA3 [Drosophila eugracilis]
MSSSPSLVKPQSNICLLWLVICKTARFQLANKLTSVIIIVGPLLVFLIYAASALFHEPQAEFAKKYGPVNITAEMPYIFYSPKNPVVTSIIEDLFTDLKVKGTTAFKNALELDRALKNVDEYGYVGIQFDDSYSDIIVLPDNVSVALRFPFHLRSNPKLFWDSRMIYKNLKLDTDFYKVEGFLAVQAKLSEALIRSKNDGAILPGVVLQQYPEPKYLEDTFTDNRVSLSGVFFLPFTISAAYLAQMIVTERREHIRDMLQLLGARPWIYWLSWFLVGFLLLSIPTIFMVILLKWRYYPLSDFFLVLFFLLLYKLEVLCSAFMISTFFSDTIGVQVAILIIHLLGCLPYILLLMTYKSSLVRAVFACLFINSSLAMGLRAFMISENLQMGQHWSNLFEGTDYDDFKALGPILILMLLGILWRLLILAYVDHLKIYRHKKWYFLFQPSFWFPRKGRQRSDFPDIERQENEVKGNPLIIQVRNLDKVYNERSAISDISLNFYENEITVILGHNDSGKTTFFKLLAGFVRPSSGEIIINGYDLATKQRKATQGMCICPQRNALFEKVKARWHLKFYCRMKGMNRKEASAEADKYLEIAQLQEYADIKVKDLPNGLKRMLMLCCNLCGNSKILLLDEPGTSLDPQLRSDMWDLLRRERNGRCIIMSTHNMYEAEVVSDQIVVLCDGEVIGYGTTGFLTQVADTGSTYLLICTKLDGCLVSEVTDFLQNRLPGIRLQTEYAIYVIYELPTKYVNQFPNLFLDLEASLRDLMIQEFSVYAPTLGSVFLRIGQEMREIRRRSESNTLLAPPLPMASLLDLLPSFEVREDDGRVKCCNQWRGIMEKKRIFAWRYRKFYCSLLIMPIIISMLVFSFAAIMFTVHRHPKELVVTDLSVYSSPVFVIESTDEEDRYFQRYRQNVLRQGASVLSIKGTPLDDYLLKKMELDQRMVHETYLAGVTFKSDDSLIIAWSNNNLERGSPLSLGMVYATIGQELAQMDIRIVNHPWQDKINMAQPVLNQISVVEFDILVFHYLILATATFAVMPIFERQTNAQYQQFASGMSRVTYWLSHLSWDYCIFICMVVSLIVVSGIITESVMSISLLLFAFGFSVISFTYLVCLISNDFGKILSVILYINMIGALALFIHPKAEETRYAIIETVLLIHPHYSFFCGMHDILANDKQLEYLTMSGAVYLSLVLLTWVPRRINYVFKSIKNDKIEPNHINEDIEVKEIRQGLSYLSSKDYYSFPLIMKNVSKRHGSLLAVRALTLAIHPFECVGLLGRNGAGKSTAFQMIVGMQSITVGSIYIKGYSMKMRSKDALQHVGFCMREDMLLLHMTGRETLRFSCLINGIRRIYVKKLVRSLAECFGLVHHMDKRISTYSNGTKRKLMIAIATLAPTLICLDEPTAGVDMHSKYDIWKILEDIRQAGRAILITTHSLEECESLCTNVGIMEQGSLLCYGSLARLKYRFNMGIFVKVKMGTEAEMNDAMEDRQRITMMDISDSEMESISGSSRRPFRHYVRHRNTVDLFRKSDGDGTKFNSDIRKEYDILLQGLEDIFMRDHPYCTVSNKFSYRGMITFCIPNGMVKWSAIFNYMENLKLEMNILYYSVSYTTFHDVFMEFVRKLNQ